LNGSPASQIVALCGGAAGGGGAGYVLLVAPATFAFPSGVIVSPPVTLLSRL
jgi:hypothetical protein